MNGHNTNRQRPKIKVAFYCRVATAAQLEEPKTIWDIPAPVYRPEEIIRKNLPMEIDTIRPESRLEAILRKNSK